MFSESIPSNYNFVNQSVSISAGTSVTFTNSSGTVIGTMTFANSAAAMVMCSRKTALKLHRRNVKRYRIFCSKFG